MILWSALHDGQLEKITSDRIARTVELTIDVGHVREMLGAPTSMRFVVRCVNVTSVRAAASEIAGDPPSLAGLSNEEQARAVAAYRARWREESLAWGPIEASITPMSTLWILEAELLADSTLRLFGEIRATEQYPTIWVRAERFEVERTDDGSSIGFEGLRQLGERYWDAFSKE